ncbi:GNAT family N-acetyltransferase [Streptomyces hygroscopicus]|uniref:GNAT family N-acetyltransferase n=1 Tax=Streptomyces hygroscopicus TaxID=1912 RepID=UPI0027E35075|nr:GNAT family N-acetyltransferase [Streptomyces hygroscopicus]
MEVDLQEVGHEEVHAEHAGPDEEVGQEHAGTGAVEDHAQREELERAVPEVPGRRPGLFVIDLDGAMIGTVSLDRRDAERPGHVRPDAGEAELGYMFLPKAWGCGYAAEACAAALDWFAGTLPSEPVVLCTQTANDRSMRLAAKLGFAEVERFEEFGAEQWFGVWSSVTPSA